MIYLHKAMVVVALGLAVKAGAVPATIDKNAGLAAKVAALDFDVDKLLVKPVKQAAGVKEKLILPGMEWSPFPMDLEFNIPLTAAEENAVLAGMMMDVEREINNTNVAIHSRLVPWIS